jgi:glutaredoxin
MGKITAYCRLGCPHSEATINSLTMISKNNPRAKIKIVDVQNTKQSKNQVITILKSFIGDHRTFPMVLYTTSLNETIFVGGNDSFQELLSKAQSLNTLSKYDPEYTQKLSQLLSSNSDDQKRVIAGLSVMLKRS